MKYLRKILLFSTTLLVSTLAFGQQNDDVNSKEYHDHEAPVYSFSEDAASINKLRNLFLEMFSNIGVQQNEVVMFYNFIEVDARSFFNELELIVNSDKSPDFELLANFFESKKSFLASKYERYLTGVKPNDDLIQLNGDEVVLKDVGNVNAPTPLPIFIPNGPCSNTGFQAGNTSGWTGSYGTSSISVSGILKKCAGIFSSYNASTDQCCPLIGSCSPWTPADGYTNVNQNNPNQTAGFNSAANNTAANALAPGVHTVMTGGNDPIVPGAALSVVPPNGNNSLRLGYAKSGYNAQALRQTFMVDNSNKNFVYHFAAVLNVPTSGHENYELPYLKIRMYDASNNPISCASLDVSTANAAQVTGFVNTTGTDGQPIYWKNWTSITIPLNPYIGQNVTIEFITSNCSQSGHYGYAYISADCNPQQVVASSPAICGGSSITLTAPPGLATYNWTGPGIIGGQGTPTVTINQPGAYHVDMTTLTTPPFVPCTFSIDTVIPGNPIVPKAIFSATSVCQGTATTFTDLSTPPASITAWNWDFDNNGSTDNTTQNPTYVFPAAGTYQVKLTSFSGGCSHDTSINVTVTPGTIANFTAPPVCAGVPTNFTNSSTPGAVVTTWNWDFDNNGTYDNTTQNPTYTFSAPGTYPVKLQVSGNAGACPDDTTINVVVYPKPNADFTATNQCLNTTTTFVNNSNISSGTITGWSWDFESNGSVDNTTQTPTNTYGTAGTYNVTLIATSNNTCRDTANVTVEVYDNPVANFTTNTACENLATAFTNTSIPGDTAITGWQWDFDNNTTIDNTTQSPSNTYTNDGTYPVTLIVTDAYGCKDTVTNNVVVTPKPTAAFTFTNVCFGTTTGFTDLSNGNGGTINQWAWDFTNNGVVDNTTQNPTNGYTAAGSYTVELLVTTTDGCKDSLTKTVPVDPIPVAKFSGTNECLGNITTFIDSSNVSTGTIASWAWNFGDGTGTSVAPSPTYTYASSGTYNVTLTVTSDSGCISNFNRNIQVYANPVANFSTDTACNTLATSFTDLTAIGSTAMQTWGWDFDNNGSADDNEQNPSFVFAGAGTYPVNLAVVDTFGCVHDTTMNVTVSENPIASYTYSNECYGTGTVFTDLSNNNGGTTPIDTWEWDYDGNGTIDNTTQSPTYIFPLSGTYQTVLYVTSVLGCRDTANIDVVVNPIPVANFSAANACLNFVTTFIDSSTISTGAISSWDWDFGNGVGTSVLQSPTYIYPVAGTFNVSLTVTSDSGCTHNVVLPVTVNPKPTADFNVNNVCLNLAAPFTDASLGNGGTINQWAWDFTNNGSVDNTTQNPTNFYAAAGTFNVQLVATTTNGCKDTIVKPVTIHPMPNADFTFANQCVSADVPFTDNSTVTTGTIDVWDWKFGDGQSANIEDPTHSYVSQGLYTVQLIVTTNNNCSDTIVKNNIEVWPLPIVNFGPTSVCLNNLTQFVDSSTVSNSFTTNTNTQWSWNFGDGIGISSLQNPMYMYGADGVFNATLIVTTNHNCVDSITKPVTVHPLPVADFTANTEGCSPTFEATFVNNSSITSGSITSWAWDFNSDGLTDNVNQHPLNIPFSNNSNSSVREYTIKLIATSNNQCRDTIVKTNYIRVFPKPLASFSYWPNASEITIVNKEIEFTDQSIIGSTWDWDFGDGITSTEQSPVHEYADTGYYFVVLKMENEYGCKDTTQKFVQVKPIYAIWIPNAFTPNGDFDNDIFYVNGYGIKELHVQIFDRWGLKIYDEIGIDQGWDGSYKGNLVPLDVYVYKIRAKDIFNEWHDYLGKVTVVR